MLTLNIHVAALLSVSAKKRQKLHSQFSPLEEVVKFHTSPNGSDKFSVFPFGKIS
jgi:hypothetical protein